MASGSNALVWSGQPGHYEVYYLTVTDPGTGVGFWIRYTMLAPLQSTGEPATASLWFLMMDPRDGATPTLGRKATYPVARLQARADPFELLIDASALTSERMFGAVDEVAWDLSFKPSTRSYTHVHPILERAHVAQTMLTLPQADLAIDGTITIGHDRFDLAGARGGQAHLWGSKHARSWAWVHCNDFVGEDKRPVQDTVIDAVSVIVSRFGRDVGPSTPVVGRIDGEDFLSTSPVRVIANGSKFELTSWRFEAVAGSRKVIGEVDAARPLLAGVTYHDPDGELAYCYNSEVASMRVELLSRSGRRAPWIHTRTLTANGTAHFEYAQRSTVAGIELLTS
jgi:hypothetical protein